MVKKLLYVCFMLFVLAGCSEQSSSEEGKEMKKVSLVLDWSPNTNHTGLYVAKEKGYFKEQGLDVELMLPGEAGANQLVASKKADFGIGYQEGITAARAEGIPIVSIAAILQHNTAGFAAPVDRGIQSPKDFEGKTYGASGGPVEEALMKSIMRLEDADFDKVKMVNIGDADYFAAVKRDIDFSLIYYGWTGIEAELRGDKLNMLYVADYADELDYYTPVITTSEQMIKKDSETVHAFMKAAAKGYEYAIDHPKEAADILIKAEPDLNPELVQKSQVWLSERYQADAKQWGEQRLEVWERYAKWMKDNRLLEGKFIAKEAFTNEFLPK